MNLAVQGDSNLRFQCSSSIRPWNPAVIVGDRKETRNYDVGLHLYALDMGHKCQLGS